MWGLSCAYKKSYFHDKRLLGRMESMLTSGRVGLRETILLRNARMSRSVGRTAASERGSNGRNGPEADTVDLGGKETFAASARWPCQNAKADIQVSF
ncbi:MAG: hypothetical protein ACJASZ_002903, partial [Yoonia sp.]